MFWDNSSRVEKAIVIWALTLVSVALLVVLVALGSAVSDNSSNVASWVQAVGSIAAIAAGFRVARFQLDEQRREQRARDAETERQIKRKQCALLFDRYTALFAFVDTTIEMHETGMYRWPDVVAEMKVQLQAFETLTVRDIPESEDLWNVAFIRTQIVLLLGLLGDPDRKFPSGNVPQQVHDQVARLSRFARFVTDEATERLAELTTVAESELVRKRILLRNVKW